jgi:hypothetical protein
MLCQQSETLAYTAYQTVSDLSSNFPPSNQAQSHQSPDASSSQDIGPNTELQVKTFTVESDDTAAWLFDLVFSPYAHSCMDGYASHSFEPFANSKTSRNALQRGNEDDDEEDEDWSDRNGSGGHAAGIGDPLEMQLAIYNPSAVSLLVQELLADWTILTENEIRSVVSEVDMMEPKDDGKETQDARGDGEVGKERQDAEGEEQEDEKTVQKECQESGLDEPQKTLEYVYFWDVVDRKYVFPFDRVKTFKVSHSKPTFENCAPTDSLLMSQ